MVSFGSALPSLSLSTARLPTIDAVIDGAIGAAPPSPYEGAATVRITRPRARSPTDRAVVQTDVPDSSVTRRKQTATVASRQPADRRKRCTANPLEKNRGSRGAKNPVALP